MKTTMKVFMILVAASLVLVTAGMVSAEPTKQTVNNSTLKGGPSWNSNPVNVTLDLENDYLVTIPPDIKLSAKVVNPLKESLKSITVYGTASPALLDISVTLMADNQKLNVTLNSAGNNGEYYNSSYKWTSSNTSSSQQVPREGAWKLVSSDEDATLHYAILTGSNHIMPESDYSNDQLVLDRTNGGKWIFSGNSLICTNKSDTVYLHMMVIDKPKVVASYKGQLTFTVTLEQTI